MLMALRDDIVDSFFPLITRLEKRVDEIEDQIYITRHDDIQKFLWEIETTRRNVASLIRLLIGKANILSTFESITAVREFRTRKIAQAIASNFLSPMYRITSTAFYQSFANVTASSVAQDTILLQLCPSKQFRAGRGLFLL